MNKVIIGNHIKQITTIILGDVRGILVAIVQVVSTNIDVIVWGNNCK